MSGRFQFPARYLALLTQLEARSDATRVWLADVGFRVPRTERDRGAWEGALSKRRWQGMHPDLMPFAEDGFGNQFCFYRSEQEQSRRSRAIVYWMYETYRAVPIASTFDGFLGWIGLTGFLAARHGDPIVDREHLDTELLPALHAIGVTHEYASVLESTDPTPAEIHRGFLQIDPAAPASLVAQGVWLADHDRALEALDQCAEASFAFPEFAAARFQAARILDVSGDGVAEFDALTQTLERPLLYGGDPGMVGFRGVPELDPNWVVSKLAKHPSFSDHETRSPLWTLVLRDDPMAPQSWVDVALDFAEDNELERSVAMAVNALFLGFGTELGPLIHGLLAELYAALGWDWHEEMATRWAEE